MKAITNMFAAGVAVATLAGAAPAAAQYFPGYGYGYTMPGPLGGYGYSPFGNGMNSQAAVNQCANAVQARLSGGFNYGYGYGAARVVGISRVEPLMDGVVVRGVATSGHYAGYGYTPNSPVDLVWRCRTDFRGLVVDVDVNPAQRNDGYNYTPWNYDYSQYGYERY